MAFSALQGIVAERNKKFEEARKKQEQEAREAEERRREREHQQARTIILEEWIAICEARKKVGLPPL